MSKNDWTNLQMILNQRFQPDSKRPERLKTGFPALDQALGGGLSSGLIILGGTPGVGKSTLALQIAAHVAESGHPVLYFSMEMPAARILAKAISQKIYKSAIQGRKPSSLCITADDLLNGTLSNAQWDEVEAVKGALPLEHLHIYTNPLSAADVLERAKLFTDNGTKPLVIIDYLQILRPKKGAQSDKQIVDSNLDCFMRLAHGLHSDSSDELDLESGDGLPVILISSLNRSSYTGPMQINAFKETGGIEYSADLLLGLQFRACHDKSADLSVEKAKSPREVELTILKNRYGSSGDTVPLQYDSAHDCFFPPMEEPVEDTMFKEEEPVSVPPAPNHDSKKTDKNRLESDFKEPLTHSSAPDAHDQEEDETPTKTPSKAFSCIFNNTKIASEIRKGAFGDRSCQVFEDTCTDYSLSEPLSSLDICVADAIYTLAQQQKKISLQAILQNMIGSKETALTKSMRRELEISIYHLRNIRFHLDCTKELRSRGLLDDQSEWVCDGPFLALEVLGKNVDHESVLPLYTYGAKIKQMITVPSVLLDVVKPDGRRLSNTQDNICLKRFLVRRLEVIRYEDARTKKLRNHLRTISYRPGGNLLEELRITAREPLDSAVEQQLKRLHKATEQILTYYQRIGYIRFARDKKGRLPSFSIIDITKDLQTLKI